jgi:hypothetical protein
MDAREMMKLKRKKGYLEIHIACCKFKDQRNIPVEVTVEKANDGKLRQRWWNIFSKEAKTILKLNLP